MSLHADVTDEKSMRAMADAAEGRFGPISVIVHAAGVMSGAGTQGLRNLDREACNTLFDPKLRGARVLESVFANHSLDLCLLVSSLSTVLGGLGHGAYASANACLDALSAQADAARGLPWTCVDWDGWRADDDEVSRGSAAARLTMSASEGIETFRRITALRGISRVVVSTADLDARLAQWVTPAEAGDDDSAAERHEGYERPDLVEDYVAPRNEVEEKIAAIWGQLLGIDRVGVNDNFLDLGGHSLLATQMLARIRSELKVDLTLDQVFERPTVAELAELVGAHESADGEDRELQELKRQVDQLTPEEHQALLEQARRARGDH
jgi:NAD(P)-dependent dehydrogenase (short-subunit alcohol dehydrogenase family)/acyl carrier protein